MTSVASYAVRAQSWLEDIRINSADPSSLSATVASSEARAASANARSEVSQVFATIRPLPSVRISSMQNDAIEELIRYQNFGPNWDGYGARPFSHRAINRAMLVVNEIAEKFNEAFVAPEQITPGPISDGRIDIEVSCEAGRMIFTVDADENTLAICFTENGTTHEEVAKHDAANVGRWLSRWMGSTAVSPNVRNIGEYSARGAPVARDL